MVLHQVRWREDKMKSCHTKEYYEHKFLPFLPAPLLLFPSLLPSLPSPSPSLPSPFPSLPSPSPLPPFPPLLSLYSLTSPLLPFPSLPSPSPFPLPPSLPFPIPSSLCTSKAVKGIFPLLALKVKVPKHPLGIGLCL